MQKSSSFVVACRGVSKTDSEEYSSILILLENFLLEVSDHFCCALCSLGGPVDLNINEKEILPPSKFV